MQIYRKLKDIVSARNTVLTIGSFDGLHRGHQEIIGKVTNIVSDNVPETVPVKLVAVTVSCIKFNLPKTVPVKDSTVTADNEVEPG